MSKSMWYAADLEFDGKVLRKISTGEVVENYASPVYRGCSREEIESYVLRQVNRSLVSKGF